jgi:hypothetical protein
MRSKTFSSPAVILLSHPPQIIIGLKAYHGGSAAALIRDGKLVAAAEEEPPAEASIEMYLAGISVRRVKSSHHPVK